MCGKWGDSCLSKVLSISASVWMVTPTSEYWAESFSGPRWHPLQCGQTRTFVARCMTFSELAELKLLSENVVLFLDSKTQQEFHFYISVVTLDFS